MVEVYRDVIAPARDLAPGEVQTHEGGIAFAADDWTRLRRFLILGAEKGTFYVGQRNLAVENAAVVRRCLDADWFRTVELARSISKQGLAHKNEPAILATAIASAHKNAECRGWALNVVMPEVCRTGTHLLHFVAYCKMLRKSSRMYRTALGNWFNQKDADALAYQAVKYKQRDGWALADVLRLSRPTPRTEAHSAIYKYIVDGEVGDDAPQMILGAYAIQHLDGSPYAGDPVVDLIRHYKLPREVVPTGALNRASVWEALLEDMPMTAMIRNLGKMTAVGLVTERSEAEKTILTRLMDTDRIRKARVHPLSVLAALKVYEQGRGEKGSLSWTPSKMVLAGLDGAFYAAFGNVPSTGKKIRLALDVSGSMDGNKIGGMPFIDARMASAAMALVTAAREPNSEFVAYSDRLVPLTIRPSMRLDEVMRTMKAIPFGGTYCSLPVIDALERGESYDAFVSYTDSETWDGGVRYGYSYGSRFQNPNPQQSFTDYLRLYRGSINPGARSVVVGLCANEFTLNDPGDPMGLDVAGFDAGAPAVIGEFIGGTV